VPITAGVAAGWKGVWESVVARQGGIARASVQATGKPGDAESFACRGPQTGDRTRRGFPGSKPLEDVSLRFAGNRGTERISWLENRHKPQDMFRAPKPRNRAHPRLAIAGSGAGRGRGQPPVTEIRRW